MTQYIDAVLHIADYPALAAAMAQAKPGSVAADGSIQGFTATPAVRVGSAVLVYVRMSTDEAAQWRGTPGVTILAEAAYTGASTHEAVYSALAADPAAMALYDAVYPRTPVVWADEDGGKHEATPPFGFGGIA